MSPRFTRQQLEKWDRQFVWHPFTQMKELEETPSVIIKEGSGINQMLVFAICVSGLIMYRHKDNIVRLINGTETQMGYKSS